MQPHSLTRKFDCKKDYPLKVALERNAFISLCLHSLLEPVVPLNLVFVYSGNPVQTVLQQQNAIISLLLGDQISPPGGW